MGACLALSLFACHAVPEPSGRDTADPSSSPTTVVSSPVTTPPPGSLWLAVLRTADQPDALDAATARLAPVLDGALVVAPTNCFVGLPADVAGYLLGAEAASREELAPIVAATGLVPTLVVKTRSACGD
jgi:hypothetical protein